MFLFIFRYEDADLYTNSQKHRKRIIAKEDVQDETEDFTKVKMDFNEEQWNSGFHLKRLLQFMGPGWLMSIAYLDPGNLESDLQSGAQAGYQLIWVLFWATIIGWGIQNLASRLGMLLMQGNVFLKVAIRYSKKPVQ